MRRPSGLRRSAGCSTWGLGSPDISILTCDGSGELARSVTCDRSGWSSEMHYLIGGLGTYHGGGRRWGRLAEGMAGVFEGVAAGKIFEGGDGCGGKFST